VSSTRDGVNGTKDATRLAGDECDAVLAVSACAGLTDPTAAMSTIAIPPSRRRQFFVMTYDLSGIELRMQAMASATTEGSPPTVCGPEAGKSTVTDALGGATESTVVRFPRCALAQHGVPNRHQPLFGEDAP